LSEADQHDLARKMTDYYRGLDTQDYRAPSTSWHEQLDVSAALRMNSRPLKLVASESEFRSLSVIHAAEAAR
jgi:hypothetical protein